MEGVRGETALKVGRGIRVGVSVGCPRDSICSKGHPSNKKPGELTSLDLESVMEGATLTSLQWLRCGGVKGVYPSEEQDDALSC